MDSEQVNSQIANFSYKFCQQLSQSSSVVSSPLSVEIVLALVALGSSGGGYDEIISALGLTDDNAIRSSFTTVSKSLKAAKGITLKVANKVYIKEGDYDLEPSLKTDAINVFDAEFQKLDFGQSDKAAHAVNSWVESKTNNKIKDLLQAADFNDMTRLVLVNALYFKGSWEKKFNSAHTKELPFNINSKTQVNIPMMYASEKYRYCESQGLGAKLLEMKYEGGEASMLVVLPNEIEGLSAVLNKLASGYDLINDIKTMREVKVDVTIPKFKVETTINLNDLLPKLGIKDIFNPNCKSINRMLDTKEELFVSKAIQKAFIEINEEGAEAAAATGAVMMLRCAMMPAEPRQFTADHPFFFAIFGKDKTTLFTGFFYAV